MTMKFFNWMHRKLLQPSVVYSRVPQKQHPDVFNDVKESEADEAVLLSNVLDGILTIGTLGIDSSCNSLTQIFEYEYDENDKQDQDQDQEQEVNDELVLPIVATAMVTKLKENDEKKRNVEMVVIFHEVKNNNVQNSHNEHMTEPLLKEDKEKKEIKRTTLADLFAEADPPAEKGSLRSKQKPEQTKCIASKSKHNKKVVHEKKKENKPMPKINTTTSSTKQVQRLISKVLKKKVHPEMGVGAAMKEMEKISLVEEKLMNN